MLFALAKELKSIYSLLGNQKTGVMPLLESLASFEETVVREEAVRSISSLAGLMTDKEVADIIYPLVSRLTFLPFVIGHVETDNENGRRRNVHSSGFFSVPDLLCLLQSPSIQRQAESQVRGAVRGRNAIDPQGHLV